MQRNQFVHLSSVEAPATMSTGSQTNAVKPSTSGIVTGKDSMGAIKADAAAAAVLNEMIAPLQAKAVEAYGDVAKNVQMPPEVQAMMDRMSVEATLKQMGALVTPAFVHKLNAALNEVPKA